MTNVQMAVWSTCSLLNIIMLEQLLQSSVFLVELDSQSHLKAKMMEVDN